MTEVLATTPEGRRALVAGPGLSSVAWPGGMKMARQLFERITHGSNVARANDHDLATA